MTMAILDFFKRQGFDDGVAECGNTSGAVLLDVRTREEYGQGHVENSVNLPLDELQSAPEKFDKDTPLFVYCLSGARSGYAEKFLRRLGYTKVKNIGGIASYRGKVVR